MSHITGTVQIVTPPVTIGPDTGTPPTSPNTWALQFPHTPAPLGTKLVILHFMNVALPGANRLEVDLGYDTDVFTAPDGAEFWTRPVNVNAFAGQLIPVRYITAGAATGSVQIDKYGRGERHTKDPANSSPAFDSFSNCDPFLPDPAYTEPQYAQFWICSPPEKWENLTCTPAGDIRRAVAQSVGMITHVDGDHLSTCSVTLIGPDLVITAGHCMQNPTEDAKSASVIFNYQTNCDGSRPGGYSGRFFKVKRVFRQAYDGTAATGDYCLFQLIVPPAGLGIPIIPMRPDLPAVGESIFGVHHPNGAVKKLSVPHAAFATVTSSSSSAIGCSLDVAGGSSGSGLFDTAGRIVGVLSNGAACGLSYYPTATILQKLAAPVGPPINQDVMVVFDRSGSMSMPAGTGRTKLEEARDAASLFVQLVRSGTGNRVGLVSFSTAASSPVDFALTPVAPASKATLVGPAPYTGGLVGALVAGGSTTIGGGLAAARAQLPAPAANQRVILLLTDGLQNTPPMLDVVSPTLSGIVVNVIGFGTEASLDGPLMTQLAEAHDGLYTRAGTGLELKKFFALAFGNIFEVGALMDPEYTLPADQAAAPAIPFVVCGEERITVVLGWDRPDSTLDLRLRSPLGAIVAAPSPGMELVAGATWVFLRVPLPHNGERDGTWTVEVTRARVGGEFPPPPADARFFVNVIASGGPRLRRAMPARRYYTGDPINPLVTLGYAAGGTPGNAQMTVTVSRPDGSLGDLLARHRLGSPATIDGDTISARQATMIAMERESGRPIVGHKDEIFPLFTSPDQTNGAFEPAGLFGRHMTDLLTAEGDYRLHFRATYGDGCTASRELTWSVHVDAAVDAARTTVTATTSLRGDGRRDVVLTITPRDRYGNLVGPGRAGDLVITGLAGTTVTGSPTDNGDGTYTVPGVWDPGAGTPPGAVITQPGRPPVVVQVAGGRKGSVWKILFWLLLFLILLLLLLLWRS